MKIGPLVLFVGLLIACAAALVLAGLLYRERKSRDHSLKASKVLQNSPDIALHRQEDMADVRTVGAHIQKAESIRFERTIGRSALEVRLPPKKYMDMHSWKKLELSEHSRTWLAPFLERASEVLKVSALAQLASTQTFRIVFDGAGELMRSQSGDGFRSILVDKHSHRIVSHGLLQPVENASTSGLLVWECAAVIVGRKYLADIDRRLVRVDSGIAGIRAFLENERIGRLQADCKLLSDVAAALQRDPSFLFCNPAFQLSLETAEQNASAVARACLLDLQSICSGLAKADSLKALSDADLTPVNEAVSKAVQTLHAISFALSIRTCLAALLCNYMETDHLRSTRLADILALWSSANEESKRMQLATKEKIDSISEWFSSKSTVEAKKQKARSEIQGFFLQAAQALKASKHEVDAARTEQNMLEAAARPIELAITVDRKGKILTVLLPES